MEGNFAEAIHHGMEAIKIEPLGSICHATQSLILHCAGKYEEALAACNIGIELDAYSFVCLLNKGMIMIAMGQYGQAAISYEAALAFSNRHHFIVNALIWAYCLEGKKELGRSLMEELIERSKTEYIAKTFTGLSAAYLGDYDTALELLAKAFEEKDPVLVMLKYEPWVPHSLKKDHRFENLLKKISFP